MQGVGWACSAYWVCRVLGLGKGGIIVCRGWGGLRQRID